ncbi:hypothetical protein BpHYR1_041747 [Brachionus plicatilis]|uniref:Transmembrane protein n=1 Tax=Brachionus plicatilis TaxID=10195 RepID=A0A3M7RVU9_BRAPC|nr:hypothetical protein BpHYR1_041747 [Brachionus plicatilis]
MKFAHSNLKMKFDISFGNFSIESICQKASLKLVINFHCFSISNHQNFGKNVVDFTFTFIPTLIAFGCVTSIIGITTYFKLKIYLNIIYNICLYCLIWNFMFASLDYCFIAIIKFHHNLNYNRYNRKLLFQQQVQFSYQQKLFHQQQSRLRQSKNIAGTTELFESASNLSMSQNNEFKESPIPNKLEFSNFFNQNDNYINFSDAVNEDSAMVESCYEEGLKQKRQIPKSGHVSYFTITVIVSILLAIPQFYGFNVNESLLALSPSQIPKNFANENDIFFVRHDNHRQKNSTCHSDTFGPKRSYMTRNLALGFVLRTQLDKKTNQTISKMKSSHKNFFTQQGFLSLASMKYSFCSIVKKCKDFIVKPGDSRFARQTRMQKNIDLLNISLVCITKSDWNELLTYNTLYFWLEHTMVISAPICIVLVVISSFIYLYAHSTKLLVQQEKISKKRMKMIKIQEQNSMAKFGTLNVSIGSNKCETRLNSSDDILNTSVTSLKNQKTYKKLQLKQKEDQNLNLMFIIDLAMFILCAFPYFFSRLILDLFSKHHEEINLDFYSILFRLSLARLLSIKPSTCLIRDYDEEYFKKYEKNEEYCTCLMCLCPMLCLNWQKTKDLQDINIHSDLNDIDVLDQYSIDFNSKLHQYNRPAEPDLEL